MNNSNTNPITSNYPWSDGEPSNIGDKDCIALDNTKNYTWKDSGCQRNYYPICNYPPSICIFGSSMMPAINGEYEYYSWDDNFNGGIFYNSATYRYLYPWEWSDGTTLYYLSTDYTLSNRETDCWISSSSQFLSPYDYYQVWSWDYDITQSWVQDTTTTLMTCAGIHKIT